MAIMDGDVAVGEGDAAAPVPTTSDLRATAPDLGALLSFLRRDMTDHFSSLCTQLSLVDGKIDLVSTRVSALDDKIDLLRLDGGNSGPSHSPQG